MLGRCLQGGYTKRPKRWTCAEADERDQSTATKGVEKLWFETNGVEDDRDGRILHGPWIASVEWSHSSLVEVRSF